MTEPTDKQLEWSARLLCVALNAPIPPRRSQAFRDIKKMAKRLLSELSNRGRKITDGPDYPCPDECWKIWEATPICPEAD